MTVLFIRYSSDMKWCSLHADGDDGHWDLRPLLLLRTAAAVLIGVLQQVQYLVVRAAGLVPRLVGIVQLIVLLHTQTNVHISTEQRSGSSSRSCIARHTLQSIDLQ